MALILSVLAVLTLLIINEAWWRQHKGHSELSRKFVHITVGSFVAFWPYLLTWNEIRLLSIAFLIIISLSKYLHIFRAIHSVQRPTWGEFFFAIAVGLLSFVQHHPHIYTVALLQMSLADGLAAIVGTRFGRTNSYHVLRNAKSVVGTLTFLIVSIVILAVYSHTSKTIPIAEIGLVGVGATLIENLGVYGSDNLLVPLLVGSVLLFV